MAPARRSRSRTSQPELPLPVPEPAAARRGTNEPTIADWRLDEETCLVGRQGIAAARAHLAAGAARVAERARALAERAIDEPRTGRAA